MSTVTNYKMTRLAEYIDLVHNNYMARPIVPFKVNRTVRSTVMLTDNDKYKLNNGVIDYYVSRAGRIIIVEPSMGPVMNIIWSSGIGEMNIARIKLMIESYQSILVGELEKEDRVEMIIGENLTDVVNNVNMYVNRR